MDTHKSLERKRTQLAASLPPMQQILRGSLFKRLRRCGKPSCHCAKGAGHPVFYVGVSMAKGKTVQVSLPPELVPLARSWIRNYHRLWKRIEAISAINRELLRQRWVSAAARGQSRH